MQPFKSVTYTATKNPAANCKLIVLGAVHGSEKCGSAAIRRMMSDIDSGEIEIATGAVTFVPITNPKAYLQNTRNGDRNLNRRLRPESVPKEFEDHVANWLCPLLAQHDVLLDLHSFQAQGRPFATVGPENNDGVLQPFKFADQEFALVKRLGVDRVVDGWLPTYAAGVERRRATRPAELDATELDPQYGVGTTEYMRAVGGWAITLECGQHNDPEAPNVGYRAIRNALAHLGIVSEPPPVLRSMEGLTLYDVVDKVHADDAFSRPWQSFDALKKGEIIGTRLSGETVRAPDDGWIVFPNANAASGNEWFYLAKANTRFA
jgi:uncharacterized protein